MQVKLIAITQGQGEFKGKTAEEIIVYAARVSSSRLDKLDKIEGLLKYCINNKHWSIFEQASMTIEITTSKAIGIQLLRHKSFSFQEFSQRYAVVNEIEDISFRKQAEKNRQSSTEEIGRVVQVGLTDAFGTIIVGKTLDDVPFLRKVAKHMEEALALYKEGLELGIAKECARMVLPMATSTTIYMTGSIRSWIHFLSIRDDEHSQLEMQRIAKEIKKLFIERLPIISKSLGYV